MIPNFVKKVIWRVAKRPFSPTCRFDSRDIYGGR